MTIPRNTLRVILLVFAAQAAAAQSPSSRADFEALVGYFTSDSATWQQENEDAAEGEPRHWVRRHTVDGDTSTAEVTAVHADGRCEAVTTIVYRWSSKDGTISTEARTASGISFRGTVEPLGSSQFRTTARGALPDGTELKMRDTSDLSVPDSSSTTAERWSDGAWTPAGGATWRRVPANAWCTASPNRDGPDARAAR